jgi:N-acylglucosamine-6-phosphate 2-epimerase
MNVLQSIQPLHHGLVVSCQAPADSPLHDPVVIAAIAQAAVQQGAVGVRIDTPAHVQAVRQQVAVPIIGLWKQQIPDFEVYITPQFRHARAIAAAGADIIAIDATLRPRPDGETVTSLITAIHEQLGKAVMADVDSLEAAIAAVEAGADLVGTTLYGYTAQTRSLKPPGFDLLVQLVQQLAVPVICEGGIASPPMAQQAIALGAYAVVVGTAITGIDAQVNAYQSALLCTQDASREL